MVREQVAVVIPILDEELTISSTLLDFSAVLGDAFFVVVDNGSTDESVEKAENFFQSGTVRGVVLREPRPGKSEAVRTGLHFVDADVYIMVDGDSTYPADVAPQMVHLIRSGAAEMVVGDRMTNGSYHQEIQRRLHGFGNKSFGRLMQLLFGESLQDVLSGYRAFSRKFIYTYPNVSSGFSLEVDLTAHSLDKRLNVQEIPVAYRDRPAGSQSKLNTFRDGFRLLRTALGLARLYRPMMFFGSISLLTAGLGLVAGMAPILDYIDQGFVYRVPLAILAVGLVLLAAIFLFAALILDSMSSHSRRQFEMALSRYRGT